MKQALLITPCNSVHTFGMNYPIDVVYLSDDDRIVKLREYLVPRRISGCIRAKQVLEFAYGATAHFNLKMGQRIAYRRDVNEEAIENI